MLLYSSQIEKTFYQYIGFVSNLTTLKPGISGALGECKIGKKLWSEVFRFI